MKRVIWKYGVQPGETRLELPKGAVFLSLQVQRDQPWVWFSVDPTATKERRVFMTRPTGVEWESSGRELYLGTFQLEHGTLVFHLFELLLS